MLNLERARKIDNYAIDATGGGLWATNDTFIVTVPSGKRWFLVAGHAYRSASASANLALYNVGDDPLLRIGTFAAATGYATAPSSLSALDNLAPSVMVIADATDYFKWTFGAAQGAGAWATVIVLEIDL